MTPADKGVCYHCKSPLPTSLNIPEGMVVCPSCLRLTPAEDGYCRHCKSPLPPSLVDAARRQVERYRLLHGRARRVRVEEPLRVPYLAVVDLSGAGDVGGGDGAVTVETDGSLDGPVEVALRPSPVWGRGRILVPRGLGGGGGV